MTRRQLGTIIILLSVAGVALALWGTVSALTAKPKPKANNMLWCSVGKHWYPGVTPLSPCPEHAGVPTKVGVWLKCKRCAKTFLGWEYKFPVASNAKVGQVPFALMAPTAIRFSGEGEWIPYNDPRIGEMMQRGGSRCPNCGPVPPGTIRRAKPRAKDLR